MSTDYKEVDEYFTAPEIIYISNDNYFKSNHDELEFSHKYINIDNSEVTKQCIDIDEQFNIAYICNIRFEPLQKNLVLKFKNKKANKTKRKKKHTEKSYLKMKVNNLLHFILDHNDKQHYDVSSVSQLLICKIKQIFKYHIQGNPSITNTNKKLITSWKSKLFFVIALDLCYENITKSHKYDINFSVRRLDKIIEYRINYFIVTRTFFGHTLKLDGIRAYELNTHNFNQLAWTEIYFDKRCVVCAGENLLNFKDDNYMDSSCSSAVQLGNIVDDMKQVLGEKECTYNVRQQINIKQLLIGNKYKIIKTCNKNRCKSKKKRSILNSDVLYILNNIDKCDIVQIYNDKCVNLLKKIKTDLFTAKKKRKINKKKNVILELKVIKLTESVNNLLDIKEQIKQFEAYENEIITQQNLIRAQVEFYLSDYNLKKNKRLLHKIAGEPQKGYLSVDEILKLFNSSISHNQLYHSLKNSPYVDMILNENEKEKEKHKNNKMVYGKVKILGRKQKEELQEFYPIILFVGRRNFKLSTHTNIQKQKHFAIMNNTQLQRKKVLSLDCELGNLLHTLPMNGVIEYDAENTFWIIKLGKEWQENTQFAQLTDKIYCNESWYKCGIERGKKYARLLHENNINIATVGSTSIFGVHITLGRCDINNVDKPLCLVVGDQVKFKIKRLVAFPPFSSKPKNFKGQEIDEKGYRYYATHWITLEVDFISFNYKTRCTPHISLCKIAVKLKAAHVQKLNDRQKIIKQIVGKKGGALLPIIHEEDSDNDSDIKEAEKKGVFEKNEAEEMQQINVD